jgi:hypothetical protein
VIRIIFKTNIDYFSEKNEHVTFSYTVDVFRLRWELKVLLFRRILCIIGVSVKDSHGKPLKEYESCGK